MSISPDSPDTGIVSLASPHPVVETVQRLVQAFATHGMTLFANIDQQAAAQESGLDMRPMVLLLFGNPRAGTPLMQAHPSLAIDLPLKALVWEDPEGRVWVSINSPDYLKRRHGLPEAPFTAVETMLAKALQS